MYSSYVFPVGNEPENPPNFTDDKVCKRNQQYLEQFPDDKLRDILKAYMEYKDGALYKAFVIYATVEAMRHRYEGDLPMERPLGVIDYRACKRDMECMLPVILKVSKPEDLKTVILGFMNLYANDRVTTQHGAQVKVPGKMLLEWLDIVKTNVPYSWHHIQDTSVPLVAWFDNLNKAGIPDILGLFESPLALVMGFFAAATDDCSWDVVKDESIDAVGETNKRDDDEREEEACIQFRSPLKNTFDAIHYLQAPATFHGSETGYMKELCDLHAYSKERYDGIIENLYASAEQALKNWATAAPEALPCLAEAESWAVSARRVSGNGGLIRAALSLVERVATECGRNQGRVVSSRAKTLLSKEQFGSTKAGYKQLQG